MSKPKKPALLLDVELLSKHKFSGNQLVVLTLLYYGDYALLKTYLYESPITEQEQQELLERGFIITFGGSISHAELTQKAKDFFVQYNKKLKTLGIFEEEEGDVEKFDKFFEQWFNLIPDVTQATGYNLRSGKDKAKTLLKQFIKKHGEDISEDLIIQATINAVQHFSLNNLQSMKIAPNFIDDGQGYSMLLEYIEKARVRKSPNPNITTVPGG